MKKKKKIELMKLSIDMSKKSKAEDGRIHPLVGAVLADEDGHVIETSYRGEDGRGGHAEYNLLKKIEKSKADVSKYYLFVTLEPCTSRGCSKIPCAKRIVNSGIGSVYIGMLDHNTVICGKGELFLRQNCKTVERFPHNLIREIGEINEKFCSLFLSDHIPNNSLYVQKKTSDLFIENLKREGIKVTYISDGWDVTIKDIMSHCLSQNHNIHPNSIKKWFLKPERIHMIKNI